MMASRATFVIEFLASTTSTRTQRDCNIVRTTTAQTVRMSVTTVDAAWIEVWNSIAVAVTSTAMVSIVCCEEAVTCFANLDASAVGSIVDI